MQRDFYHGLLVGAGEYIAVTIGGIHAEHPEWRRLARVHFRRLDEGWQTVGFRRADRQVQTP